MDCIADYLFLYTGKVCLCNTNRRLYHKDLCPERGLNHSKVVIRNNEKAETKEVRRQMCYLSTMGQMAHQNT